MEMMQPGAFGDLALTFDDVMLVPQESDVLPYEVDTTTRLCDRLELNIPHRLGRDGHGDRGTPGGRARPARRPRDHPPQHAHRAPGRGGRPGQALRGGDGAQSRQDPPGSPRRRGARADGAASTSRASRSSTPTITSSASSPTATCASTRTSARPVSRRHDLRGSRHRSDRDRPRPGPADPAEARRVEKLPIVDDEGRLRGLITVKDITKQEAFPLACKGRRRPAPRRRRHRGRTTTG